MTDKPKRTIDALADALETCVSELVMLKPRLREPFLSNVAGAAEKGMEALRLYAAGMPHD